MKKLNKKGFTLVELVIVIAVIAILAAVLIPVFSSIISNAKESAAMQDAKNEFETYLANKAKDLKGDEDFMIKVVDGTTTYWFEVTDLQFNAEAITGTLTPGTVDLTKAYKATAFAAGTTYEYDSSTNTYSLTIDTSAENNKTYYEQYDIGNTEVAIYNAN